MLKELPKNATGATVALTVDGAATVLLKWYVAPLHDNTAAAAFELLNVDGETYKLVDELNNGWMSRPTHMDNLIEEIGVIADALIDFEHELRDLRRKRSAGFVQGKQLELPLGADSAFDKAIGGGAVG